MNISLVSYLNSYPFHYGLLQAADGLYSRLDVVSPSQCAMNFHDGVSDVALVPVGALASLNNYKIIRPFCIGADGAVRSVLLVSRKPLAEIRSIASDIDSRSSNALVKILCAKHWAIQPKFVLPEETADARVAIGDKAFALAAEFPFCYDLAEAWKMMTGLPFVFAIWIARPEVSDDEIARLNLALESGVSDLAASVQCFGSAGLLSHEALDYLSNNISFRLDARAEEGMNRFMTFWKDSEIQLFLKK